MALPAQSETGCSSSAVSPGSVQHSRKQEWQMSNKAHNSGNMCSKIFTKTARDAKGVIKTNKGRKRGHEEATVILCLLKCHLDEKERHQGHPDEGQKEHS